MDFDKLRSHYVGQRAQRYEQRRVDDPKWHREQETVRDFLLEVVTDERTTVLDVPVGTGRFFGHYAELGCEVIGIDISSDMLSQAAQRASEFPSLTIDLQIGDVTALGLPDQSVDVAVCIRFASLVDTRILDTAVGELSRVAKNIIIGMTTTLKDIRGRSVRQRLRHLVQRSAPTWLRGIQRVVVHPPNEIEDIFMRHTLTVQRSYEVRRRPARGDVTTIYLLRNMA